MVLSQLGKVAQWVKVLADEDHRTWCKARTNSPRCPLTSGHKYAMHLPTHAHVHTHTRTHTHGKSNNFNELFIFSKNMNITSLLC